MNFNYKIKDPKKEEKTKTIYHIFTDNRDEYTDDYAEAEKIFKQFKEYGCARLYEEIWNEEEDRDEPIEENCLKSYGSYPL